MPVKETESSSRRETDIPPINPIPLPNLPVPPLHQTLQRYLEIIKPIVSDDQYKITKIKVEKFGESSGEGEMLQEKLLEYAKTKENWIYDWWLNDMYLKNRLCLPVNSNPGMVFPRQIFQTENDQFRFASRLICGILDYKVIIDRHGIPIDHCRSREKGQPLCMEQYYRLFSSYRIPGLEVDYIITPEDNPDSSPEHIIVACKNQFFILDTTINYQHLGEENFCCQLGRISRLANQLDELQEPVGILTSMDRTNWAQTRNLLLEDPTNREALEAIEHCIFVLCLDDPVPEGEERSDVSQMLQMLHGGGCNFNSMNRWFDKTMQFIVAPDGACGLNYEHSPAEGVAVVQLVEHLLRYIEDMKNQRLPRMVSIVELAYPRRIRWKLTDSILQQISYAKQKMDDPEKLNEDPEVINNLVEDLDIYILRFKQFGKDFPKSQNMSPDSFIQLALQLTYYKVHGHLVSTYESASTRRFQKGRVDNIRAASSAALEWVKTMTGTVEATDEEKMRLLRVAMKVQTEIMINAILGQGTDNHLFGLKQIALENDLSIPDMFEDESYKLSNHFTLSTSQILTTTDSFMGYGPVVPDGYGASYNPHPDFILFVISSWNNCPETRSDFFAWSLESSLMQIYELCLKTSEKSNVYKERKLSNDDQNGSPKRGKIRSPMHAKNRNRKISQDVPNQ